MLKTKACRPAVLALSLMAPLALAQVLPSDSAEQAVVEQPCQDMTPTRRAYFGDSHVHTGYSLDAWSRMGAQTTPDDAYNFARGEKLLLPPFGVAAGKQRSLKLSRPLDFAAVTDHAEDMAMVRICSDPQYDGHDSNSCGSRGPQAILTQFIYKKLAQWTGDGSWHHCGLDGGRCDAARVDVWQDTIAAATRHNAPCEFTTFNGYEWSGGLERSNMHRNVIFANDSVIEMPLGSRDYPHVEQLWQALDAQCLSTEGCDVVTIPHNSNLSMGNMFSPLMSNGEPMTQAVAERRQRYERLAEIVQQKGESECYYQAGLTEDELCSFAKLSFSSFAGRYIPFIAEEPQNDSRYLREALREGLRIEKTLGVNPFTPGFIGSTDTHIAAAGGVEESTYAGHHGSMSLTEDQKRVDIVEYTPGGLAVLYAEQNTRESLFAAIKRREAYATSGTRIGLRLFAGADLPEGMCDSPDLAALGYQHGVPMGADLNDSDLGGQAPVFVVAASADGEAGQPLQRLQIIKNWVDDSGVSREAVVDVAGDANNGAGVDAASCRTSGQGASNLCARWQDPAFDAGQNAFYYARAVENPSCAWTGHACVANQVNCSNPDSVPESLAYCCDSTVPKTVQERAWSSPIWYRRL